MHWSVAYGNAFTPARMRALQPRIQRIVENLLDDVVAAGGGVDLVPPSPRRCRCG